MDTDLYIATTRLGMGVCQADVDRAYNSPQQWLISQIAQSEPTPEIFSELQSTPEILAPLLAARKDKDKKRMENIRLGYRQIFPKEVNARVAHALTTATPFYERLVNFWSNHFAVSVNKKIVIGFAGAFEREAIRPNITGRFIDMLLAVTRHPAMLVYLDNAESIGFDSIVGQRVNRSLSDEIMQMHTGFVTPRKGKSFGLNENLAREIMELHTLGVGTGYTQQDVTNFAKVITGWSIGMADSYAPGSFEYVPRRHEPGTQVILGKSYPDNGEEQGIEVLSDLAAHPATAHHIAFKLARHFIADDPPEEAVQALAINFQQTGGDLQSLYRLLISRPEVWSPDPPKIKSGYDLVISAARLCGATEKAVTPCVNSLHFLDDLPMTASSPAGRPDVAEDIAGPDALLRRIEWAQGAAKKFAPAVNYKNLAELAIGPIMQPGTRDALRSAKNEHEGLALLLASPEFQRR